MDSTRAIIRLWRLCSPHDVGPQVGGDGALPLECLKVVLARELPEDHIFVTGEEVSSALLAWLEDLVEPDEAEDGDSTEEGAISNDDSAYEGQSPVADDRHAPDGNMFFLQDRAVPQAIVPVEVGEAANLTAMLERYEQQAPAPTTWARPAEWHNALEFHAVMSRRLVEARAVGEEMNLASLHRFVSDYMRASRRLRNEHGNAPRVSRTRCTQVLYTILNQMRLRRIQAGWGSLVALRREGVSFAVGPTHGDAGPFGNFDIFNELLQAQCQTSVMLETRVKVAGRAGTLAFCISRLLRRSVRSGWVRLEQHAFVSERHLSSTAAHPITSPNPPWAQNFPSVRSSPQTRESETPDSFGSIPRRGGGGGGGGAGVRPQMRF